MIESFDLAKIQIIFEYPIQFPVFYFGSTFFGLGDVGISGLRAVNYFTIKC